MIERTLSKLVLIERDHFEISDCLIILFRHVVSKTHHILITGQGITCLFMVLRQIFDCLRVHILIKIGFPKYPYHLSITLLCHRFQQSGSIADHQVPFLLHIVDLGHIIGRYGGKGLIIAEGKESFECCLGISLHVINMGIIIGSGGSIPVLRINDLIKSNPRFLICFPPEKAVPLHKEIFSFILLAQIHMFNLPQPSQAIPELLVSVSKLSHGKAGFV